jgi:ATP-dependent Lon protease
LKGATEIKLTDPYIRLPYQFKNLLEFCVMLAQNKAPEDEVKLHVTTWNSQEYLPESELSFQELIPSIKELGIDLTYEYQNLHDRNIVANNGWRIQLGRGLDIFEPRDGKFDPAEYYQERRSCKNCEVIYMQA